MRNDLCGAPFLQNCVAANASVSVVQSRPLPCPVSLSSRCFGDGASCQALHRRDLRYRGAWIDFIGSARDLHLRGARNGSLSGHSVRSERACCRLSFFFFFSPCLHVIERAMLQYFLIEWARNTRAGRLVTLERNRRWCEPFSPFSWRTSRVLTEEYVP